MKFLSHRAAKDYLWAIRACHSIGLASWTETLDRLLALRQMCSPTNPAGVFAMRMLTLEGWPVEDNWSEEGREQKRPSESESNAIPSKIVRCQEPEASVNGGEEPPTWLYMVSSVSGLNEWRFHQYDDDPYPSVPHGHKRTGFRWKLDAYQGWVYERTRQDRREPRWRIVALWNDAKFRSFALDAIEYHIEHFPHHNDWRVANPLRLPRARRR